MFSAGCKRSWLSCDEVSCAARRGKQQPQTGSAQRRQEKKEGGTGGGEPQLDFKPRDLVTFSSTRLSVCLNTHTHTHLKLSQVSLSQTHNTTNTTLHTQHSPRMHTNKRGGLWRYTSSCITGEALSTQDYPNVLNPDKWLNATFPLDFFFLLRLRPRRTRSTTYKVTESSFLGLCHHVNAAISMGVAIHIRKRQTDVQWRRERRKEIPRSTFGEP